jgi:tetratricopeptide (TPR) repeat protein
MATEFIKNQAELEALFRKYENAPDSYVFAPLADAYRKAGMLEEAVEICRKGVRKNPGYPSGHVVLGKCYFDVGEVEMAGESFRSVLELDENNLVALKYLGMIQAGRGRLDAAREHFKHILVLDPDNREIIGMMEELQDVDPAQRPKGESRSERRDEEYTDSSQSAGDDSFEGGPISLGDGAGETSDELATMTLADIYAAQGYSDKAARIYREVLRKQPDNLDIKQKLIDVEGAGERGETFQEIDDRGDVETLEVTGTAIDDEPVASASAGPAAADDDWADEPARPRPTPVGEAAVSAEPAPSSGASADDQKSYDQFKRWLKNLQD